MYIDVRIGELRLDNNAAGAGGGASQLHQLPARPGAAAAAPAPDQARAAPTVPPPRHRGGGGGGLLPGAALRGHGLGPDHPGGRPGAQAAPGQYHLLDNYLLSVSCIVLRTRIIGSGIGFYRLYFLSITFK